MIEQLPTFNLIVTGATFLLGTWAWLTHRLWGRGLRLALGVAVLTLFCGSAAQAGLISMEMWTALGAAGRLGVLGLIVLTVFDPGEPAEVAIEKAQQKINDLNGTADHSVEA